MRATGLRSPAPEATLSLGLWERTGERRVKGEEGIGVAASGTFLIEISVLEIAVLGERLRLGHTLCPACCRERSHCSACPLSCHFPCRQELSEPVP